MKNRTSPLLPSPEDSTVNEKLELPKKSGVDRRAFLKNSVTAGAAVTVGVGILAEVPSMFAQQRGGEITKGDAAILSFLAAAEIIESDLWLQYQELGGTQDNEVSTLASKLIPGYPAQPTGG